MEHLQRFYWSQYREVIRTMRHGRLEEGLDTCLELLHEPDLNLHLRVLVNTTIAEFGTFERHPNKADFAEEAIRVAEEAREVTVGAGPRAQATLNRAIFLANRSLEVVKRQTEERNERLAVEAGLSEEAARGERVEQQIQGRDDRPITPRLVTGQQGPASDTDVAMDSSPPEHDIEDAETPRASGQQYFQDSDVTMSSSPPKAAGETTTSTSKLFSNLSGEEDNTSGSDIGLPPAIGRIKKLPLLQKDKSLPTPEVSDVIDPPSDDKE